MKHSLSKPPLGQAVEKAVTEFFQINKANKLLQEENHSYMIYDSKLVC